MRGHGRDNGNEMRNEMRGHTNFNEWFYCPFPIMSGVGCSKVAWCSPLDSDVKLGQKLYIADMTMYIVTWQLIKVLKLNIG